MTHLEPFLTAATQAARIGGDVLMRYWRDGVNMRSKADGAGGKTYDLVSDADLESENEIAKFLHREFPQHELLGEENLDGSIDAEHLWIIDPLDGTNNFAHRLAQFAVSVAYYHRAKPQAAAVFNPATDEMFTATLGGGAYVNGSPLRVSHHRQLSKVLIGCGFYYDRGETMRRTLAAIEEFFTHDIHGIRRLGAASLDLCHVARGSFGGFFEYQLSPWDFAGGALIVTEAGGKVTDAKGGELSLTKSSVVISNSHLHDDITSITRTHHP